MIDQVKLSSTLGNIEISANEQGVTAIHIAEYSDLPETTNHSVLQQALTQLNEYFSGERQDFDLPLAPKGTKFQQQVWQQLQKIPYGETFSYSDIAQQIDNPKAVRAVGAANGANPICIVVPCHRVIGKNNKLTGFAYGVDKKEWLLNLEGALP